MLQRRDIPQAADVFAEQFMEDPLYIFILPDRHTRLNVLRIFFRNYLDMLYPYSDLYASSSQLEAVMLVFYSEKFGSSRLAQLNYVRRIIVAIIKSLPACKYIGVKGFLRGVSILRNMSSAWLSMLEDRPYAHMDMLVVQQQYRGTGVVTKMIMPLIDECASNDLACTLETQNPNNVPLYGRYGFELVDTIKMPDSELEQYCMVFNR
ncbi:GNAT family N-acetyltransferase [Paenibacillus sp. SC116]|uniref:GNAT family N-acetyltransferase n=1 Tax=Paenibacillus sp. SC116 TaxID=2968986 RepID=UPI00215A8E14|nr:GNAT family N-acetyltransferase [Paenibacillus sp. SC116]MCR8843184.1 GNAT family N-acetyltransferase [Paenibacillus sp. SC116]